MRGQFTSPIGARLNLSLGSVTAAGSRRSKKSSA
jgi:hypothetical protein